MKIFKALIIILSLNCYSNLLYSQSISNIDTVDLSSFKLKLKNNSGIIKIENKTFLIRNESELQAISIDKPTINFDFKNYNLIVGFLFHGSNFRCKKFSTIKLLNDTFEITLHNFNENISISPTLIGYKINKKQTIDSIAIKTKYYKNCTVSMADSLCITLNNYYEN